MQCTKVPVVVKTCIEEIERRGKLKMCAGGGIDVDKSMDRKILVYVSTFNFPICHRAYPVSRKGCLGCSSTPLRNVNTVN